MVNVAGAASPTSTRLRPAACFNETTTLFNTEECLECCTVFAHTDIWRFFIQIQKYHTVLCWAIWKPTKKRMCFVLEVKCHTKTWNEASSAPPQKRYFRVVLHSICCPDAVLAASNKGKSLLMFILSASAHLAYVRWQECRLPPSYKQLCNSKTFFEGHFSTEESCRGAITSCVLLRNSLSIRIHKTITWFPKQPSKQLLTELPKVACWCAPY